MRETGPCKAPMGWTRDSVYRIAKPVRGRRSWFRVACIFRWRQYELCNLCKAERRVHAPYNSSRRCSGPFTYYITCEGWGRRHRFCYIVLHGEGRQLNHCYITHFCFWIGSSSSEISGRPKRHGVSERFYVTCLHDHFYWWCFGLLKLCYPKIYCFLYIFLVRSFSAGWYFTLLYNVRKGRVRKYYIAYCYMGWKGGPKTRL